MKVKDLLAILVGNVTIKQWNEETEDFKTIHSSTNFHVCNLSEDIKEMEVDSIYADTEDKEQNFTIVEVN